MKKHLLSSAKILILALVVGLGVSYISAQTPPPCSSPASCNVPAPLNVGSAAQNKNGALGVGGFVNFGQSFLAGDVGVLNSKIRIGSLSTPISGNDQYLELGYDTVHSIINSHGGAGSSGLLINYANGEDVVIGGGSNPSSAFIANGDARFEGQVKISDQSGTGIAFACFDADGNLYRSPVECLAGPSTARLFEDSTPGTHTWQVPSSITSPTPITVEIWGAGGGGAGGSVAGGTHYKTGGGGGGGAYVKFTGQTVNPGGSFTYTIGSIGAGGATDNDGSAPPVNGTSGGQTSFFNRVFANGGQGGGGQGGGSGGTFSVVPFSGYTIDPSSHDGYDGANGATFTNSCITAQGGKSGENIAAYNSYGHGGAGGKPFKSSGPNGTGTVLCTFADGGYAAQARIKITW